MKHLSRMDIEAIAEKYIRKYNPQISQSDLERCLKIARGEEEELIYEPKKEVIEESTKDGINIEVLEECINSGLIDLLGKMKEKDRKESLKVITNSLEKRVQKEKRMQMIKNAKVAPKEETPKVKRAEWRDDSR